MFCTGVASRDGRRDRENARFLWKRLPDQFKQDGELAAEWNVGKYLYSRVRLAAFVAAASWGFVSSYRLQDYANIYASIVGVQWTNATIQSLAQILIGRLLSTLANQMYICHHSNDAGEV